MTSRDAATVRAELERAKEQLRHSQAANNIKLIQIHRRIVEALQDELTELSGAGSTEQVREPQQKRLRPDTEAELTGPAKEHDVMALLQHINDKLNEQRRLHDEQNDKVQQMLNEQRRLHDEQRLLHDEQNNKLTAKVDELTRRMPPVPLYPSGSPSEWRRAEYRRVKCEKLEFFERLLNEKEPDYQRHIIDYDKLAMQVMKDIDFDISALHDVEANVQQIMSVLFRYVALYYGKVQGTADEKECTEAKSSEFRPTHPPLRVIDTHQTASGLAYPPLKPDHAATSSRNLTRVTWPELVWPAEYKAKFTAEPFEAAVVDVINYGTQMFLHNPDRKFMYAFVTDYDLIAFVYGSKQPESSIDWVRTDWMPFTIANNPGFNMFLRLVHSSPLVLGWIANAIPGNQKLSFMGKDETGKERVKWIVSDFVSIDLSTSKTTKHTLVYQAQYVDENNQRQTVVVKFGLNSAIELESTFLRELLTSRSDCIPTLINTSSLQNLLAQPQLDQTIAQLSILITKPVGEAITKDLGLKNICKVFVDVLSAMALAAADEHNILHCDLSPANIICIQQGNTVQGILIDWGHARYVADIFPGDSGHKYGTQRYCALRCHFSALPHTVLDDIESLFYILLEITSANGVPWKHETNDGRIADNKELTVRRFDTYSKAHNRCDPSFQPILQDLHRLLFCDNDKRFVDFRSQPHPCTAQQVMDVFNQHGNVTTSTSQMSTAQSSSTSLL